MHRFQKYTVNLAELEITSNPKRSPHADNNDCYIHKQKRYTPQKHLSVFNNLFSKVSHYLLFTLSSHASYYTVHKATLPPGIYEITSCL